MTSMSSPSGQDASRPTPHRPTLEKVAAHAGVSRATASRVLRGDDNVSAHARAAVQRAADELAYSVNRAARSLVTRRSDSIAFLVAETEDRTFHDPYFLGILRGAQAEVAASGMQLVFVMAATDADAGQFLQYATSGHVDGVLLVSLHGDDHMPQQLERLGVPTVLNGRPMSDDGAIYSVDSDNRAGGRTAAERLIGRGATRIATITGPMDMSAGLDRLSGYRAAMTAARIPMPRRRRTAGDFTVDGGAAAMERLLAADPDIDAVFAASDLMAIGALRTLARHGRRVPDDVAVVGFDDVREAALTTPSLTTVRQPIAELGRGMARVLIDRISGRHPAPSTILPVELVARSSA